MMFMERAGLSISESGQPKKRIAYNRMATTLKKEEEEGGWRTEKSPEDPERWLEGGPSGARAG